MKKFRYLIIVGIIVATACGVTAFYNFINKPQSQASELAAQQKGKSDITYRDDLYDIDFADAQLGWAVGGWGRVFHTKDGGKNWASQNTKTQKYLFSVDFTDQLNGWIVGNYGTILHTSDGGMTWEAQQSGTDKHLFKVAFINEDEGWAVGYWGAILHTLDGGKTWWNKSIDKDLAFNDLSVSDGQCWVVGEFGSIYHTADKGEHWEKQPAGVEEDVTLFGIDFVNSLQGWAVGLGGTVLHTQDGGKVWKQIKESNGFKEAYFDVASVGTGAYAVGGSGTIVEIASVTNENGRIKKITPKTPVFSSLSGACGIGKDIWVVGYHGTIFKFGI